MTVTGLWKLSFSHQSHFKWLAAKVLELTSTHLSNFSFRSTPQNYRNSCSFETIFAYLQGFLRMIMERWSGCFWRVKLMVFFLSTLRNLPPQKERNLSHLPFQKSFVYFLIAHFRGPSFFQAIILFNRGAYCLLLFVCRVKLSNTKKHRVQRR